MVAALEPIGASLELGGETAKARGDLARGDRGQTAVEVRLLPQLRCSDGEDSCHDGYDRTS